MQKRQHGRWSWVAAFVSLAIVLTGAIAATANAGKSTHGVCATISKYGLQKQMNIHAAQILAACGRTPASQEQLNSSFSSLAQLKQSPRDYGGTHVNIITGGEGTFPHVTQSETQVWAAGKHCRVRLQRLEDGRELLFGRLVLDERWRDVDESEHAAVLHGSWHRLRRSGRDVRPDALEVDRRLPRLRMRGPGARCLDVERRRDLGHGPVRTQQ